MLTEIKDLEIPSIAPTRSLGLVLVVDDEEQNRILLRDPLEARGYTVEEAENGMEALRKIVLRAPDVILLDLMMPKMDGFEVCRLLRRDPGTAHVPILMITALSERGDRLLGIQAGANDFLNKPIDLQDVMLRVGNAVYAKHLHDKLQIERQKSERLLLNILPGPVAERMKQGETNIADSHPDATVLVADLVGFTTLSAHVEPTQVVLLLNEIFCAFDVLVANHGLEKIKTVGDAYMVAGGITNLRTDHAEACAALAIELRHEVRRFNQANDTSIRLQIGISTGPVVSGVIGRQKFAYDIWGETVNLACRLESSAKPGKIQVSESTRERLKDLYHFVKRPPTGFRQQIEQPGYWLGDRITSSAVLEANAKIAA